MAAQFVLTCSNGWHVTGPAANPRYICSGTLKNVSLNELNSSGLSAEDWAQFREYSIVLFAVVFCFLALKKAFS